MRRTQLYLDDDVWQKLHDLARERKSTISDLVRQAVQEKYMVTQEERQRVFNAIVGLWKDRDDIGETEDYIRSIRSGHRLEDLQK